MESDTVAGNATIKQLQRAILQDTKWQFMKESNFIAGNATIKQLQRIILLNTKGQYMKESNILANNVVKKFHQREVLQETISLYIKAIENYKHPGVEVCRAVVIFLLKCLLLICPLK